MLSKNAHFYYKQIIQRYENSYLAEDKDKVIIGIDATYLDSNEMDFSEFKSLFYECCAKDHDFDLAGFFGVFSFDFISLFEKLEPCKKKSYDFPLFLFANAKAYLLYEKTSKMYFKFGDEKYFSFLKDDFKEQKRPCEFEIMSDLNKEEKEFKTMLSKAKEYFLSGDVFQVVLSKELCVRHNVNSFEYYEILSTQNASAYMFYFPSKYGVVLGSSPELVLSIKNKELFVAPIAGTRRLDENSDIQKLEKELLRDEKELCEHRMLVDLARNDISKFGEKTRVENAFSIVSYRFVMHIVSSVYARLKQDASIFDAISSVFPAGTLSGAPKIRALEIINELEDSNRGVYGGAVGFLRFNEDVLLAILIRSAFFTQDKAYIRSGAGVVHKSDINAEYDEIKAKRQSLIHSFELLKEKNDSAN